MKFLAVFVAVVAAASALTPTTVWTQQGLEQALSNPQTDHLLVPFLADAHAEMLAAAAAGHPMDTIIVTMPYIASFTLNELSEILQNPETNPSHIPYYEAALNELMTALMSGEQQEFVTIAFPGDIPVPAAIPESPVAVPELVPSPVEVPVEVPVEAPASSPLVQIIVNVNKQQQVTDIVSPVVVPAVPEPAPTPVNVVEEAFVPELIIPTPVLQPNPVDIIAITPVLPEVNPVDVIAITPVLPEVNPVDVIAITPVNPAPAVVGPFVR